MTESPLYRAVRFGAQFDLASVLHAMLMDWRHGPIEIFIIHAGDYYDAADALNRRRIRTWGWRVCEPGWFSLHCRRDAAGLVALALRQAGVPYTTSYRGRNR